MLLCLLPIVLGGCGPSAKEIAQRQEAERQAAAAAAAEESARQQRIAAEQAARAAAEAARQAKLRQTEQAGDQAAQAGDLDTALASYEEVLVAVQGNGAEDQRLREKIIKTVIASKTTPPIPEEARRHAIRAQVFVKTQQSAGFAPGAAEMAQAVLIAPWWGDGYYNLGVMQEGAEDYAGAIRSLRLSVLADPHGPNAEDIKTKTYELEVLQEEAEKVRAMSGTWTNPKSGIKYEVTMEGKNFTAKNPSGWVLRGVKNGNDIEGTVIVPPAGFTNSSCFTPEYTSPLSAKISQDGHSIKFQYTMNNYNETYWNLTGSGPNNTGHNQGDCISVTLQGSVPDEFEIAR
jgi:hypothetical protein